MSKIYITITIICLWMTGFSQNKITIGKPYGVVNALYKFYFYQKDEILTVKRDQEVIYIQKMKTSDLSFVSKNIYREFPLGFEYVQKVSNKYILFYSNRKGLFGREIDFQTGTLKEDVQQFISAKTTVELIRPVQKDMLHKYKFLKSIDNSFVAFQYRIKPESVNDNKSHDRIGISVFDGNLKEVWSKIVAMPYTEKKMNILDYSVNSKGDLYFVASVYEDDTTDEKKRGSETPNYHLEIFKVTSNTEQLVPVRVNLTGNFLKAFVLFEGPKGSMMAAGSYNRGKKFKNTDGLFQFKLDADDKPFEFKTHEIPLSVLNMYTTKEEREKNYKNEIKGIAELGDLSLEQAIVQNDNSMLLLGELSYKTISNGGQSTTTHSNDIFITKLDSIGNMSWMKRLPKAMVTSADWPTYRYISGTGEHHLLMLDNMKNIERNINASLSVNIGWEDILMRYTINDQTGEVTKKPILDLRDVQGTALHQFNFDRVEQIGSSSFVFESYSKDKQDVLIKVELSE